MNFGYYCQSAERVVFVRLYLQMNETINQYPAELTSLATHCDFGHTINEQLKGQLILAINNLTWQK